MSLTCVQWVQRNYSNIFPVATMWDQVRLSSHSVTLLTYLPPLQTSFALDFVYQVFPSQQVRVSNQTTQCLFSQANSALTSLACDCSGADGTSCYTSAQLQLLSLLRACQNLPNNFDLAPYGYMNISATATFTPVCLDLELSLARAALFQRSKTSVYSSVCGVAPLPILLSLSLSRCNTTTGPSTRCWR